MSYFFTSFLFNNFPVKQIFNFETVVITNTSIFFFILMGAPQKMEIHGNLDHPEITGLTGQRGVNRRKSQPG